MTQQNAGQQPGIAAAIVVHEGHCHIHEVLISAVHKETASWGEVRDRAPPHVPCSRVLSCRISQPVLFLLRRHSVHETPEGRELVENKT
ncbi:hypothetical protein [Streptomyces sp. NPDC002133]|uniref:hypothetical protein n=1 Tax=Streptomyces sp. NPDC002133 TaxID=3154409 RepID=UPI00332E066D